MWVMSVLKNELLQQEADCEFFVCSVSAFLIITVFTLAKAGAKLKLFSKQINPLFLCTPSLQIFNSFPELCALALTMPSFLCLYT